MAYGEGTLNLSGNLNVAIGRPLDARYILDSEENLTSSASWTAGGANYAYDGMMVYCKDTNKTYQLQGSNDYSVAANWHEVGGGGGGSSNAVTIDGTQTITGEKTFTNAIKQSAAASTAYGVMNMSDVDITAVHSEDMIKTMFVLNDKNQTYVSEFCTYMTSSGNEAVFFSVQGRKATPVNYSIWLNNMGTATTAPAFYSGQDNTVNLGMGNHHWKQVFASTATINTSDERLKADINSIPDVVLDAWGEVQFCQFRFTDAKVEKGDAARKHSGLIAQRIQEAFEAHGLDAAQYGLFCHDVWDAEPEQRDAQGNIVQPAMEAGDRYALRYEEALCMEAAYQRRRADRLEARLAKIEDALANLA